MKLHCLCFGMCVCLCLHSRGNYVITSSVIIWCDIHRPCVIGKTHSTALQFPAIDNKVDGLGPDNTACHAHQARIMKLMPY